MAEIQLTDFTLASSTTNVAAQGFMGTLGTTLNQISNVLSGPVLYVILGLSLVITLYGLGVRGINQNNGTATTPPKMGITVTGFAVFVLTAGLKGLASFLHGNGAI